MTWRYGVIFILGGIAAHGQFPPSLSQYAPLNASQDSTYFEDRIEREVGGSLRRLAAFGVFDHLAYRVDGGVVTLSGEVINPDLRGDAQMAVSTIDGVNYVDNQIRFLTVSPAENQVRKSVFVAIYADRSLRLYSLGAKIHIVVQGNRVTLEGEVSSAGDRQRAENVTKTVRGVASVVNHLSVSD